MGVNPHALYLCLLDDLHEQVPGYESSWASPCASVRQIAAGALERTFYKKCVDWASPSADSAALDKFIASNSACSDWRLAPVDFIDDLLIGGFRKAIREFFEDRIFQLDDENRIFHAGRFGPGASVGARGSDFYTKAFSSVLTCTSLGVYEAYSRYIEKIHTWRLAEETRQDAYDQYRIVEGSRLSFVPKNQDTSRCICVEPSLNMFAQLGFGRIIEQRLLDRYGIDLAVQPDKNRELARIGSEFGSFATIDLSSASDSVSLRMIRTFLPSSIIWWLERYRSPNVELPDGSSLRLDMLSSMGNGFTFPLQTAIFACVVSSAFELCSMKMETPHRGRLGNFAVFGDDIIIPTRLYRYVTRLLSLLGFSVNEEKSFNDGWFRESCGCDYYKGRNVRGVYVKSLKTPQSCVVVINRLNRWSAVTGIFLPKTVGYLMKRVPKQFVPLYENDDAGIKVPSIVVKKHKRDPHCQSVMYTRWHSRSCYLRIIDGGIKVGKREKTRFFNEFGLLNAFLHGSLRNMSISIRLGASRYGRRRAVTPNWDWLPDDFSRNGEIDGWRLECATLVNISWIESPGS